MTSNRIDRVSNHSRERLDEIDRKNLVGKTKVQSPTRYNKRLNYSARTSGAINTDELITKDELVAVVPVGDYKCTVAFNGVIEELVNVVSKQVKHNVTLQSVIRAITRSIDDSDILVDCTCGDFTYRYAYWATKWGYKYGKPERRPAEITNPDDKLGAMCKHLTALLSNKRWLVKVASTVNAIVKDNIDSIRELYDLSEDEFFINVPGRPSVKTGRNTRMFSTPLNIDDEEASDDSQENVGDNDGVPDEEGL